MANAKMCDRCGQFYRDEDKVWVKKNGYKRVISGAALILSDGSNDCYYDLCQSCITELIEFFHLHEPKEEEEKEEEKSDDQD